MEAILVDYMGTDVTVVNAARVSFNKESSYKLTEMGELLKEKDSKLLYYLARHEHFTPFTHCTVTMRERVPLFVARQRFKHTIGFSYNEVSRRYVDEDPEFYKPEEWRGKASDKKQGSSNEVIDINPLTPYGSRSMIDDYDTVLNRCLWVYKQLLRKGVCPEQARMVLPQSMYTEYYVTGSLYAWARAYNLRSKPDAQQEIQELASSWHDVIIKLFPESWLALTHDKIAAGK
jgi:thymidylate synthase (FAD)|tara:strand:- start:1136 stop:1831 length:696 start_codon:yes stop_codon:yes gene_type:complete